MPWSVFRGISQEKATGLGAVAGGFAESLFSPLFWIVVILFFGLFFAAGRLGNKIWRIMLILGSNDHVLHVNPDDVGIIRVCLHSLSAILVTSHPCQASPPLRDLGRLKAFASI